jgi:hypothetical protein
VFLNLTQHQATPEQQAAGVVDTAPKTQGRIATLLTFNDLPERAMIRNRARDPATLAKDLGAKSALIGGEPFLTPLLANHLTAMRIHPLFAFSMRDSEEQVQPDGSIRNVVVSRHIGYAPALQLCSSGGFVSRFTTKQRRPGYYRAPLRSREDISGFLTDRDACNRGYSPLVWNVKCYHADLSFDHLIDVFRTSGEYGDDDRYLNFPEFLEPARKEYEKVADRLWEWAIEDACRSVTDDDVYRSLWDGTEIDVSYAFKGRSGGWLCVETHNGVNIARMDQADFQEYLEELAYTDLRRLYQLTVQNDHDFSRGAGKTEIEFQAAFALFNNLCADIPRPDKTQKELPLSV